MAQSATVVKLTKSNETEIAVLQVQFTNLNEKVDDLKLDLKDVSDSIDRHMGSITQSFNEFKADNKEQHQIVEDKISDLEKWRYTIMGGAAALGALGFHLILKLMNISL
jgi:septation ring formation regulator EzrA